MTEKLKALVAALSLLSAGVASGQATTYGTLAPGALNMSEQSGVRAEICRDLLVDPADANVAIPSSYRLLKADELAKDDPTLQALLAKAPRYAKHHVGSLCFMLVEYYDVDGVRVIAPGKPSPMAFWWVRAERTGEADPRMQGKAEWLQLASWYADKDVDRAAIIRSDPTAEFVPLDVEETAPGKWQVKLKYAGGSVEATIAVTGEPQKRRSGPGFMTVPYTGASARYFTVFTYFGHHHQTSKGTWSAAGDGPFARAFGVPGEASAFGTFFQSRWQARAALYEFKR